MHYGPSYMSTISVNVLPRALNNATDIHLIMKSKAPGEKLAFHPLMVSHVASPIDPPVVKTSGWKVARVSPRAHSTTERVRICLPCTSPHRIGYCSFHRGRRTNDR